MKVYNSNVNQQIRNYLSDVLDVTRHNSSKEFYEARILDVMNSIKSKDEKAYTTFLSTIFSDYYKVLYCKKIDNKLSLEEEGYLIFFDSLKSVKTLSQELNIIPELVVDMVDATLKFNELDYFAKRKSFLKVKNKNTYLQQINPNHFIDQVYYCQTYDPDKFISLYKKHITKHKNQDPELAKDMAIESLSSIYEELKLCDPKSIQKIGFAIVRDYYIYKKYEFKKKKPNEVDRKIISSLEQDEIEKIGILSETYDLTNNTRNIIKGFIEYNVEKDDEYHKEATENLKNNVSSVIKTKLHYDKRRKTV